MSELILTAYTYDQGRIAINNAFSGTAEFNVFSASTIYSGSTDLYNIFLTEADGNDITRVQSGANIITGGTANSPIVNLADSPSVENFISSGNSSFNVLSASTIYSGSTDLGDIIASISGGTSGGVTPFVEIVYFSAGNILWDVNSDANVYFNLTADTTLQVAGSSNGMIGTSMVIQDGGHKLALSGTNKIVNGGGGVLNVTSTAGAEDIVSFVDINGVKYWNIGYNYNSS